MTTASATETLCECDAPIDEPRYYSTASNTRTLIGSYVANLTEEPDFRRAAYVLYALLALLACCAVWKSTSELGFVGQGASDIYFHTGAASVARFSGGASTREMPTLVRPLRRSGSIS